VAHRENATLESNNGKAQVRQEHLAVALNSLVEQVIGSNLDAEAVRLLFGGAGLNISENSVQRIIRLRAERAAAR